MKSPQDYDEFERWVDQMIDDAKTKLGLDDSDLAWTFLRRGTEHYFRTLARSGLEGRAHD